MIKTAIKENYGAPLLRKLVEEANGLGIAVSFWKDMEGKYILTLEHDEFICPKNGSISMACWFVRGMITVHNADISALMAASNTRL